MKKSKCITMLIKSILFCIIFISIPFSNDVFAIELTLEQQEEVKAWLTAEMSEQPEVYEYFYTDEGTGREDIPIYCLKMPDPSGNIVFNDATGQYYYNVTRTAANGDLLVIGQVPLDIRTPIAKTSEGHDFPGPITLNNIGSYTQNQGAIVETVTDVSATGYTTGTLVKIIHPQRDELGLIEANQVTFAVVFGDEIWYPSPQRCKVGEAPQGFFKSIETLFNQFGDGIKSTLTGVINGIILAIADGLNALINWVFGTDGITLAQVVFGNIDKLSINFWETKMIEESSGVIQNAPAPTLKPIVSYWYDRLTSIVIVVYIVMLLYIGIRILLASTGKSAKKYKEMLTSWLTGIIIIAFFPYVMKYTVVINDLFVEIIETERDTSAFEKDAMRVVREKAGNEENPSIPLSIAYIIMTGQLIVLLATYYKRVLMIAFLITIFPITAGLYIWEKAKGGGKALTTWTKEFVILVLVQTFHAVIYTVLIEGALIAYNSTGNWLLFILSVTFLFEGEKIIRAIFNQKSSTKAIGELAASGAAAWAATKGVKDLFKKDEKSKDEEKADKEAEAEADRIIAQAKRQQAIDRSMRESIPTTNVPIDDDTNAPPGTSNTSDSYSDEEDRVSNEELARAIIMKEALANKRKRSPAARVGGAVARGVTRAAGVTLGMTSGLAQGSVAEGIKNTVVANELLSMPLEAGKAITGHAANKYAGRKMRNAVRNGEMDEKLRELGINIEDSFVDSEGTVHASTIREALANLADNARSSGSLSGKLAYMDILERGTRKEDDNNLN